MSGAQITVTNEANGFSKTVTSDSAGNYTVSQLPIGKYDLSVESKGFKKATNQGIVLNVNDKLTVNMSMQVGDVTQEVQCAGLTCASGATAGRRAKHDDQRDAG